MNFYGYKNHLKVDHGIKFIGTYTVSDAVTHDSQELETLTDKDDAGQKLYADSAYIGQEESINWCGMQSEVHEKGTGTKKLTIPESLEQAEIEERSQRRTRVRISDQIP